MRARAPGKVVLSGAYAVLEGAPALVSAVNGYVVADSGVAATFEAPEVRAAMPTGPLPHIDVSALYRGDRKLGLGSSAAIVVSSLAAVTLDLQPDLGPEQLAMRVWKPAVAAHRAAQGGGSGIDVVTSALGGTRKCWLTKGELQSEAHALPEGLVIELYAARASASTPRMLRLVRGWGQRDANGYRRTMSSLINASMRTVEALNVESFVRGIAEQTALLAHLGECSGAPIVPEPLHVLATRALAGGVAIHPSGAGGGDIVLCMGESRACERWREALTSLGLDLLDIGVNAPGVHREEVVSWVPDGRSIPLE